MLSLMPRLLFASLVVFAVAPAVCVSQFNEHSAIREPVKLILDTDMSGDCDDAGALALLHALADRGECEILAVVTNRRDLTDASAAAVDAINTYYGRGDIPIGTDKNGPTALQRAGRQGCQRCDRCVSKSPDRGGRSKRHDLQHRSIFEFG